MNQENVDNWPKQEISQSKTIVGYVAREANLVYVKEILGDDRFPAGTGRDGIDKSVICYPLTFGNGQLFGVAEFVREATSSVFAEEDLEIACSYMTWGSIAVQYASTAMKLDMHTKILDFVDTCTRWLTDRIEDKEKILKYIAEFGKKATYSDHYILFLRDNEKDDLYIHDTDFSDPCIKDYRLTIGEGFAGNVMNSLKVLNSKDAYADSHFSRTMDQKLGYTTKTALTAPIIVGKKSIGVIQFTNKSIGIYNDQDEETIKMCASFYGLTFSTEKTQSENQQKSDEILVLKEMFTHHSKPRKKDVKEILSPAVIMDIPSNFYEFSFDFYEFPHQNCKWSWELSKEILNRCQVPYCDKTLVRFVATVKRNYRDLPYHNFNHAFSVSHFNYLFLQRIGHHLSKIEILASFFGALCHDLDHRGRNNAFFILINHPLAKLYDVSVLENHHYYVAKHILSRPEYDIFTALDQQERSELMSLIKDMIIATDLMEYFKNRNILAPIVESGEFDWKNPKHRKLALCLIMTNCDLCGSCKPFEISKTSAIKVFEEFYAQGDEELELGFTPIPMFTRKDEMALNQAGFLNAVVMPCVNILKKIVPNCEEIEQQTKALLDKWEVYAKEKVEKEISDEEIQQLRIPGSKLQENSVSFVKYNSNPTASQSEPN